MMTSLATLLAPRELGARLVASQMRAAHRLALAGACLVPVTGTIGWFVGTPQVLPLAVAIVFAALGLWARRDIARSADAVLPLAVIGQCIAFTAAFAGSPWQLDSHMLFFATLAVLAALLNVRALLVATVAVAAHHLALGLLVPALVFPSTDLFQNLGRALFHAAILLTELGGLILLVQSVTSLDATNTQTIQRQEALQRSTDAAMADQQRAVEVLGRSLGEIARRNLRVRLSDLPSGFARLQSDFNTAIQAVDQTLGQINHGTMDLRSRIAGIDAGTARLSESSQAQAAGLERTSAALAQLNASFGEVVDKAEKAAKAIEAIAQRATDGRGVVAQAVSAMSRIESSSARISRMNDMIEDIAFQTNLLALNAGVEAARAGEAGRGFAVVAAEVRGLSMRATETASEIDQMVRESGEEVAVGARLVGHAGDVLSTIADAVVQMTQGLREIVSTAQDQSRFVSEIGTSMHQLDQITRQNAELFFETAGACAELTERIGAMSNRITSFDLDSSREAPEPMRRAG